MWHRPGNRERCNPFLTGGLWREWQTPFSHPHLIAMEIGWSCPVLSKTSSIHLLYIIFFAKQIPAKRPHIMSPVGGVDSPKRVIDSIVWSLRSTMMKSNAGCCWCWRLPTNIQGWRDPLDMVRPMLKCLIIIQHLRVLLFQQLLSETLM